MKKNPVEDFRKSLAIKGNQFANSLLFMNTVWKSSRFAYEACLRDGSLKVESLSLIEQS